MTSPRKGLLLVALLVVSLGLYWLAETGSAAWETVGLALLAGLALLTVWWSR